jgi:putative salt-induced outer membrane protein YdiY
MRARPLLVAVAVLLLTSITARGDVVELTNGDRITGKVGEIAGGKMKFTSPVLGEITIDMANVKTFSTDEPATIQPKDAKPISDKVMAGIAEQIETAGGTKIPVANIKRFNPPPQKWTGSLVVNGTLQRGNTNTEDLGFSLDMTLRRMTEVNDDRFSLGGAYNFGRTGRDGAAVTTTDNWDAYFKYDRFWTEKLYGYANIRVDHDRIAFLNYRLTPGVGLGYQWYETPTFSFNTEAGISYVYESFDPGDDNDFIALRLAYHLTKKFNDKVSVFHNLEYLPAFEDPGDYILNVDAGIRAMLTKNMFAQFKAEWVRDSTPAEDRQKNDLRYILGVGWTF